MLAAYLDSTNLKPEASTEDIQALGEEAIRLKMAAVCVHPARLEAAARVLKYSGVNLCTVIGFPLGADLQSTKVYAARGALNLGAKELDMVINIGAVKDKDYHRVKQEIEAVNALKSDYDFQLKIIVETALLLEEELRTLTRLVGDSGADFIKTSTGFASRGVSLKDIEIINSCRPGKLKIKASGGIKTLDFALELIKCGVDRIGTSSAAKLMEEYQQRGGL